MRTSFLIYFFIFLSSGFLRAETINCQVKSDNGISPIYVNINDKGAGFYLKFLTAKVEILVNGFRQGSSFSLKRKNRAKQLIYNDKDNPKTFSLIIQTTQSVGIDIPASLIINEGRVGEKKFADLLCNLSGKFLPTVYACPTGQAGTQENLNKLLISAAKVGSAEQVENLLDCGANPNYRDGLGCTSLLYVSDSACGQKPPKPTNDPLNPQPSEFGLSRGMMAYELTDVLVSRGAIYDAQDPVNGETALIKFTKYQDLDSVRYLVDSGADVNIQDNKGNTSLIRGAMTGDSLLVSTILNGDPDLGIKNKEGMTAYSLAKKWGYEDLLELLQAPSAFVKIEGKTDGTCTPMTLQFKKDEATQLTLKATSDKMFKFAIPTFGIDLMAMQGETVRKVFTANAYGSFQFTCGIHGGAQTQGTIIVK